MAGVRLAHLPAFLEVCEPMLIFVKFITCRVWATPSPSMDVLAHLQIDLINVTDSLTD